MALQTAQELADVSRLGRARGTAHFQPQIKGKENREPKFIEPLAVFDTKGKR